MPPQVGFYILVTDVGGRGGDVCLRVVSDNEEKAYTGPIPIVVRQLVGYLEPDALPEKRSTAPGIKGAIKRLMYGADQPDDEKPPG